MLKMLLMRTIFYYYCDTHCDMWQSVIKYALINYFLNTFIYTYFIIVIKYETHWLLVQLSV